MLEKFRIKRGNDLIIGAKYALPITGYTIRSQVRIGPTLVEELTITIIDAGNGEFAIESVDTSLWPLGSLLCDIKYTTPSGEVKSTETFTVECIREITE